MGGKQTSYDADTRLLAFIISNQAAGASWHINTNIIRGERLQMLFPATMERGDITAPLLPATSTGRHQLHYQVRDLVNGVAGSLVQAILKSSVSCAVASVTRGCSHGSEVYDSNFFVATFERCHVLSKLSWLRTLRPPTRKSSSTIFGMCKATPVLAAARLITRVQSVAVDQDLFELIITANSLM